mgnify:FL=1
MTDTWPVCGKLRCANNDCLPVLGKYGIVRAFPEASGKAVYCSKNSSSAVFLVAVILVLSGRVRFGVS